MDVLIEGLGPDAIALARLLAEEGNAVRLAGSGPGPAPGVARELRELGIRVESRVDLDAAPGDAEIAYLDVWTPEVAPRVGQLRARGTRTSCLADLLLARWQGPSIGITGTAGKTTTTTIVAEILRCEGVEVAVSRGARAGNLWPTADLVEQLRPVGKGPTSATLLLELTSSHLAFMSSSPTIAAVISFWPDHLELHGDLARYRAAKEAIVRHQRPGDVVVVNADDASAGFAAIGPARRVEFSLERAVEHGAYLDRDQGLVVAFATGETALGHVEAGAAAGTLAGTPVIDDGMAATPLKAAATLARYPNESVVLIAGGLNDAGGGPVHAAPEERVLLERACDEIARAASVCVLFGAAGPRLAALLRRRDVGLIECVDLVAAVAAAARVAPGASAVVFSPLFPVSLEDRARFAILVHGSG